MAERESLCDARHDGLDYVRHHYNGKAQKGRRVTIYTGETGTIIGSAPGQLHYLYVLPDGAEQALILHPTWKVKYLDEVRDAW